MTGSVGSAKKRIILLRHLGRLVLILLASWHDKQAVPCVTESPLVTIHDWNRLSYPYGLFNPSRVVIASSVGHLYSQLMMQLSAWCVIVDLCSTFADSLSHTHTRTHARTHAHTHTHSLFPQCRCEYSSCKGSGYAICLFAGFHFNLWMH